MKLIFKTKEEKLKVKQLKVEKRKFEEQQRRLAAQKHAKREQDIKNILLCTSQSIPQNYKIIGLIASSAHGRTVSFSEYEDEIKSKAYKLGADAVIGITFQTTSEIKSYNLRRDLSNYDEQNPELYYTEVFSTAVGTAIKFNKTDNR